MIVVLMEAVVLRLKCSTESPGGPVKPQVEALSLLPSVRYLIQYIWDGTWAQSSKFPGEADADSPVDKGVNNTDKRGKSQNVF